MRKGENISVENTVFRYNTGSTALFLKDAFFEVSYNPRSAAEMNARMSHMVFFFWTAKIQQSSAHVHFPSTKTPVFVDEPFKIRTPSMKLPDFVDGTSKMIRLSTKLLLLWMVWKL